MQLSHEKDGGYKVDSISGNYEKIMIFYYVMNVYFCQIDYVTL